jgi:hypothetical protein
VVWDLHCEEHVVCARVGPYIMGGTCGARGSDRNGVQNCSRKPEWNTSDT